MYTPFTKLLCAAALASSVFAQYIPDIEIVYPKLGTSFKGGDQITVQLKEIAPPSTETVDEVSLVIAALSGSFDPSTPNLGNADSGFQGVFTEQWADSEGNKYANFSIAVPNWFNGPGSLNVAHWTLTGGYGYSSLVYKSVDITVYGNSG